jgi:hypothetical protein
MRASKKVKGAVLLTAGAALLLGAPTVYADDNTSSGNSGLLSGVQLLNGASVNAPIDLCGVSVLLAGSAAKCSASAGNANGGSGGDGGSASATGKGSKAVGGDGGDAGSAAKAGKNVSKNNDGLLNGLQVGNNLHVNAPITACGVGALIARGAGKCDVSAGNANGGNGGEGGDAKAKGKGSKAVGGDGGNGGGAGGNGSNVSSGNDGLLSGAQLLNNADVNLPITLCGVALLAASAGCSADVDAGNHNGGNGGEGGDANASGKHSKAIGGDGGNGGNAGTNGNNVSSNNDGILSGLQALNNLDVNAPITVCGLALLGRAGCAADVDAGNANGGNGGDGGDATASHGGTAIGGDGGDGGDGGNGGSGGEGGEGGTAVAGAHADEPTAVRDAMLPHTGAAGLALIPFGLALVAGGVALRRRSSSER